MVGVRTDHKESDSMSNKSNVATAKFKESVLRGIGVTAFISYLVYYSGKEFPYLWGASFLSVLGLGLLFYIISFVKTRNESKKTPGKSESE